MTTMRYLSLFSGIEACTVAWHPLGWECVGVAEIEPFPSAVLAQHYHSVPNLGDVTKITDEQIAALGHIDLVVGGSPCQDLSVAGKRAGLVGVRSGLFHEQLRIFNATRHLCGARFLLWENVPGAFSSNGGADFAVVAGQMAGCEINVPVDGWGNEGLALGDNGLVEWAVLDAQWFGVAQRRRRVFALLDTGDWPNRPPILLERDSLRGDSAPSRKAGENVAGNLKAGASSGGWSNSADHASAGYMTPVYGGREDWQDVAQTIAGCANGGGANGPGRDVDSVESLQVVSVIKGAAIGRQPQNGPQYGDTISDGSCYTLNCTELHAVVVAPTLPSRNRSGGGMGTDFDLGGGLVLAFDTTQITSVTNRANPQYGDACHTLHQGNAQTIAFTCKDYGADASDISPTLRSMNNDKSHANGSGQVAVCITGDRTHALTHDGFDASEDGTGRGTPIVATAVALRGREGGATAELGGEVSHSLRASGGGGDKPHVLSASQVRRLTPVECARLQGFADHYLDILHRGKPAADGPKYKALGNSMAVPCMAWIGRQIDNAIMERT